MNGVPVTNNDENQQQKSDQQQAGGFRCINRVPVVLVGRAVLAPGMEHANIVRPAESDGLTRAGVNFFVRAEKLFSTFFSRGSL
jgi:hypothetical protein